MPIFENKSHKTAHEMSYEKMVKISWLHMAIYLVRFVLAPTMLDKLLISFFLSSLSESLFDIHFFFDGNTECYLILVRYLNNFILQTSNRHFTTWWMFIPIGRCNTGWSFSIDLFNVSTFITCKLAYWVEYNNIFLMIISHLSTQSMLVQNCATAAENLR